MTTATLYPNQTKFSMADFLVKNIVAYNKIETQLWQLGEGENRKSGNFVIIRGIPDLSHDSFLKERAMNRLRITLEGKSVGLKAAKAVEEGTIECDVFLDTVNVANYFSDFTKSL